MNDMLIEKSRSGVYQNTSENRRLHRVGQRYGKVVQKEEDFESFADRYEKEYRRKHSGSPVKNSEIRYEALKAWDKMHSSENSRLHHVGQKYGGAKKDETKQEGALPKVNLSEKDFTRHVDEEAEEEYPNAKLKLHYYQADRVEYFNSEGQKRTAVPFISEFYSDGSQSSIGGYEAYFDKAGSIGTFKTKESAIAALNKYVNAMRGEGHSEPEKQVEKVSSKVEKQPVKENDEKQDKPTSRVTFADVPRSREVNLKKYLTDSRRKDVDRLMQTVDGMSSSAIKQAHDAAVKKFNDNFDNMKKSERASALYVIMKYKDLLNKAKSLDDENKVARKDIVNRMSDAKVSFGSIEQILREGAEKKSGDSGAVKGDIEVDLSGSYNDHAWKSSGRSKPKKTYQLILHTDADAGAFNRGTLTRDQIKGVTLVESNPWEGSYVKIKDMDLDDLPVRADRK